MNKLKITLLLIVLLLPFIWLKDGFEAIFLDLDTARDLHELSNIWIGRIVWLGPDLSAGFQASPLSYYIFYPALWMSGGNARSIIYFNMFLSLTALVWLGWQGIKKHKPVWLLAIAVIGLSPWWWKISLHPGNGDTYVIFLLVALTSIWFKKPFWLSSILLGVALALHPAAIFALPILLYEALLKKRDYLKNLFFILAGLIIPWVPNLIFIYLTKGYWIRQWLTKPSLVIESSFDIKKNLNNITLMGKLSGLSTIGAAILWIFTGLAEQRNRLKVWYLIASLSIILFVFISPMPDRYLYGITTIASFVILISLVRKRWGWLVLLVVMLFLVINIFKSPLEILKDPINISDDSLKTAERSIPMVENNIDVLIEKGQISKREKIAVLTALKPYGGITPQANDYRFFLRTKGYQAPNVPDYSQADVLIMFIEDPDFDWEEWRSWEIDQLGEKELRSVTTVGKTRIIVFEKK